MMDVPYKSFLSSKPFLVKGPEAESFYVHGNLIAQHSKVLAVDVHGPTLENKKETIEIKDLNGDFDDATVMRFIEYAYTGDYTVPDPVIVPLSEDIGDSQPNGEKFDESAVGNSDLVRGLFRGEAKIEEPTPLEEDWSHEQHISKKERKRMMASNSWYKRDEVKRTSKEIMWSEFQAEAHLATRKPWEPRINQNPCEGYSEVLLSHARLYVFSGRYECEALMMLSLQKLHLTLSKFVLHKIRTKDITELVKYTYEHTVHYENGFDKLRLLVLRYVVCNIEKLMLNPSFQKFLEEPGPLAKDVMVKILERLD